jgi:DNA-binding transcriptional ArsR family regulator
MRSAEQRATDADLTLDICIDRSVCYDFVVSLRALFNPRTYTGSRRWAAVQLPRLGEDVVVKAKFFFAGFDTALGYGAARLVPRLEGDATPGDLISAASRTSPGELAMYMLDTGDTTSERLALFRRVLDGDSSATSEALDGLPPGWASRCRQVLRDPEAAQADLVEVLQTYLSEVYRHHQSAVSEAISAAAPVAEKLLEVLPPAEAIERLTGGYTVAPDLGLRKVTLAPSVFIHPFMSARIDEESREAFIVYGVPSEIFDTYDPVPLQRDLVTALKAMSDPNRLSVLRLLAERPMYTTELLEHLRLAQTTVHHHLAQLRAAGLVRQERHRGGMQYSVRSDEVLKVLRSIEDWILNPASAEKPNKEALP